MVDAGTHQQHHNAPCSKHRTPVQALPDSSIPRFSTVPATCTQKVCAPAEHELTWYSGSSKWLKQVCAVGSLSLWGPALLIVKVGVRLARPLMGTLSLPVTKNSSCFCCSGCKLCTTFQNHWTACQAQPRQSRWSIQQQEPPTLKIYQLCLSRRPQPSWMKTLCR